MLNPLRLGLAGGIIWGLSMFICTLLALYIGYGVQFFTLLSDIYPGYSISWSGSILGMLYGFADAFIGFYLLAWIYNMLNKSPASDDEQENE